MSDPELDQLDIWNQVIADLSGTCGVMGISEEVEALFDNLEFCAYLDQHIFLCSTCGWWCEISEEASHDAGLDELTCEQCVDEMEGQ